MFSKVFLLNRRSIVCLVAFVALVVCYVGCAAHLDPNEIEIIKEKGIGLCKKNGDCLAGQICMNSYCQAIPTAGGQYASIQILPPPERGSLKQRKITFIRQQFIGIDIGQVHRGIIQTREGYLITGEVLLRSGSPLEAELIFTDLENIKGRPLFWEVETNTGRFQTRLSYGKYRIKIKPKDSNLPVKHIKEISVTSSHHFKLTYPTLSELQKIKGRLVTTKRPHEPIVGQKVRALSEDGLILSNTAITQSNGQFELLLPPGVIPHRIRFMMNTEKGTHFPRIEIPYTPPEKPSQVIDLGEIPHGFLGKMINVEGDVKSVLQEGDTFIPNAKILLRGNVSIGTYNTEPLTGTYTRTLESNAKGHFSARVLPGEYQVEVIPPIGSKWARSLLNFKGPNRIQSDHNFKVIALSAKPQLTGQICREGTNSKSLPAECTKKLQSTRIQAISLETKSFSSSTNFYTGIAHSDGHYELPLDPGCYDLIFIPSLQSGLARTIYSQVKISSSSRQQKPTLDAFLPRAKHFIGQVIGSDRFPIANATIQLFESKSKDKGPARLLGSAETNSQGIFSIPYTLRITTQKGCAP